jgi:hypothetical protein
MGMRSLATYAVVGLLVLVPTGIALPTTEPTTPEQRECDGHVHQHGSAEHNRWSKKLWNRYKIRQPAKAKHRHMMRCAETPKARAEMRQQWKKAHRMLLPPNHDVWLRVGRCEQPGSGYGGVNWRVHGPTYEGGLGFYTTSWDAFRRKANGRYISKHDNAGDAPWREQMRVAQNLWNSVGWGWGCSG